MEKIKIEQGKSFMKQAKEVRFALLNQFEAESINNRHYFEYFLRKEYEIKFADPDFRKIQIEHSKSFEEQPENIREELWAEYAKSDYACYADFLKNEYGFEKE